MRRKMPNNSTINIIQSWFYSATYGYKHARKPHVFLNKRKTLRAQIFKTISPTLQIELSSIGDTCKWVANLSGAV